MTDLREIKRRLQERPTRTLRCTVFRDGEFQEERTFNQNVVKIGKLSSSHLVLDDDDVARMHAVLERSGGHTWRLIDLGSATGVNLDGERVDKSVEVPDEGRLTIGPFEVAFSLGPGAPLKPKAPNSADPDHHKAMMDGLMAEMEKHAPHSHLSASFMQKGWHLFDDERKRKALRMMVSTIRESREESRKFDERSAAAMLTLGAAGIEAIYGATRGEALAKAQETLKEMTSAKQSLELFRDMNLMEGVGAATKAAAEMETDVLQSLVYFKKGHEALIERLETVIAAGTTVLLACLSRAGGAELSDEERRQVREQWDAAVNAPTST